ncbi:response regulator transcription factor [Erwiniaceae bacterium BAC15a-03b]|uniref:Response regulator transcription factor n=1 Tax=Winslowiella arboricola TaxID=2978220 RepID=A0A9J6PPG2_9GAMM|nr:response regulator transcription factor [Winslowiella arboricola]MCU5772725.1 response regulator transcription factor [Winslowiella arboricola]MCU5778275.1 response regulator transcription factor [Winslowiella arboricola]
MTINIAIAHEHKLIRCGIKSLIKNMTGKKLSTGDDDASYSIINDVSTPAELVSTLNSNHIDLLLLGYTLNTDERKSSPLASMDGYNLVKWLRNKYPHIKIVVMSPHRHASLVRMMLGSGISGYISMDICEKTLERVMSSVLNNEVYVENDLMRSLLNANNNTNEISPKESEVLRLLCQGLSLTKIAGRMNLSIKTVSAHKLRAMDKLAVESDCQLYFLLSRSGLFDIKL